MEFLGNLHTDVKLLLVGAALALVAALLSGSKRKEHRYMAIFTLLMVGAGYRIHQQGQEPGADTGVNTVQSKRAAGRTTAH